MGKIVFLTLSLLTVTVGYAQRYAYVRDNDMYVNVRSDANAGAAVIDTLYNLQIVQIHPDEKEINDWVPICFRERMGYVHKSRLRDMPKECTANLTTVRDAEAPFCFITSVECPEIVVSTDIYQPKIEIYTHLGGDRGTLRV